jgi:hypothetical protein
VEPQKKKNTTRQVPPPHQSRPAPVDRPITPLPTYFSPATVPRQYPSIVVSQLRCVACHVARPVAVAVRVFGSLRATWVSVSRPAAGKSVGVHPMSCSSTTWERDGRKGTEKKNMQPDNHCAVCCELQPRLRMCIHRRIGSRRGPGLWTWGPGGLGACGLLPLLIGTGPLGGRRRR